MDHISCLQPIPHSKKSQIIQLKRNGDGQLTEIQICEETFSYINRLNGKPAFVSINMFYDLHTGTFWWRYYENKDYFKCEHEDYLEHRIEMYLNHFGYRKNEEAVYNYYDEIRSLKLYNLKFYFFFSANKMAKFYVNSELTYTNSKEQYKTFELAYEAFLLNIKKYGIFPRLLEGEVVLWKYLDRHFFRLPYNAQSPTITKLVKVKHSQEKWMIEIEGTDWREETYVGKTIVTVVLNENYEFIKIWGHGVFKNVEHQNLMAPTRAVIHVEDSKEKQELEHPLAKGKIEIEAMTINYHLPSGKQGSWTLILWQYYHCHKLFGWYFFAHDYQPTDKISDTPNPSGWQISEYSNHSANKEKIERFLSKVYFLLSKEEKMVCFMPHFPSEIWCQEFTEEQPDLYQGFRDMCHFLENRLFEVEDQDFGKWYRRIPVGKYLSSQFFQSDEGGMVTEANVKISKVIYKKAQWKLKLESTIETKPIVHNSALFILDENYNVIKVFTEMFKG